MSAQSIYDTAPLGSLIRYSNGEPRPPERFTRKLKAWNNDNGIGRLVERVAEEIRPPWRSSAGFCLHLGNYGSQGIIAIVVRGIIRSKAGCISRSPRRPGPAWSA